VRPPSIPNMHRRSGSIPGELTSLGSGRGRSLLTGAVRTVPEVRPMLQSGSISMSLGSYQSGREARNTGLHAREDTRRWRCHGTYRSC
jgi:hypothetical protein